MNVSQLKEELISRHFKMDALCIGERDIYGEDKFTVNFEENCWQVYYVERGRKHELKVFPNESEACIFFLNWVTEKPYLMT